MSTPAQDDKNTPPSTFKEAYDVLQRHAETLRKQQEPNIDELVNIVTESVVAYKVCKERIQAVEQALERTLSEADEDGGEAIAAAQPELPAVPAKVEQGSGAAQSTQSAPGSSRSSEEFDDDIPF